METAGAALPGSTAKKSPAESLSTGGFEQFGGERGEGGKAGPATRARSDDDRSAQGIRRRTEPPALDAVVEKNLSPRSEHHFP